MPSDVFEAHGRHVSFSLTSDGVDFVGAPRTLVHHGEEAVSLKRVSPRLGPSFGNTRVDIYGSGFRENTTIWCYWFANVSTSAVYLSDNHIQCSSSPMFVKESEKAVLMNISVSQEPRGSIIDPYRSEQPAECIYYANPSNLNIQPVYGANLGGTLVKVSGTELADVLAKLDDLDIRELVPFADLHLLEMTTNTSIIDINTELTLGGDLLLQSAIEDDVCSTFPSPYDKDPYNTEAMPSRFKPDKLVFARLPDGSYALYNPR